MLLIQLAAHDARIKFYSNLSSHEIKEIILYIVEIVDICFIILKKSLLSKNSGFSSTFTQWCLIL